jgi:hypothetical protein
MRQLPISKWPGTPDVGRGVQRLDIFIADSSGEPAAFCCRNEGNLIE